MEYRYGSHTVFKIQYHFVFVTKYRYQSASKIFESFPDLKKRYWGRHFWSRGYFCVTSGELTEEMINNYLEHHFEPKGDDNFKTEA